MQALDQYLSVGDVRLRFRDEGQGMPVAFVHGWTLDLDMWNPQAAELSLSMRVLRWDRRGYGLSSGRPNLVRDVADLQALLDHLQVARASLVGMSQGARVALAFALRNPDRVASLILDGPPNDATDTASSVDEDVPFGDYRELVRSSGVDTFRRLWREHPFVRLHSKDPEARALLDRILARYPGFDLIDPPPTSTLPVDMRSLAAVRAPILIVSGQLDSANRNRAGDQLHLAAPLAARTLVPDAGHLANLDNPRAYNDVLRTFLQRQSLIAA